MNIHPIVFVAFGLVTIVALVISAVIVWKSQKYLSMVYYHSHTNGNDESFWKTLTSILKHAQSSIHIQEDPMFFTTNKDRLTENFQLMLDVNPTLEICLLIKATSNWYAWYKKESYNEVNPSYWKLLHSYKGRFQARMVRENDESNFPFFYIVDEGKLAIIRANKISSNDTDFEYYDTTESKQVIRKEYFGKLLASFTKDFPKGVSDRA